MKTYYIYIYTVDANGTNGISKYSTTDARNVLDAIRGCIRYSCNINVIVNGKSVAHV